MSASAADVNQEFLCHRHPRWLQTEVGLCMHRLTMAIVNDRIVGSERRHRFENVRQTAEPPCFCLTYNLNEEITLLVVYRHSAITIQTQLSF